jgi:hypothetical protein
MLFNHSDEPFHVKQGDRIAQLILEKISTEECVEVNDLLDDETERGSGGFGSTGIRAIFKPKGVKKQRKMRESTLLSKLIGHKDTVAAAVGRLTDGLHDFTKEMDGNRLE